MFVSWIAPQPALGLSDRLALIVGGLCRALAAHAGKDHSAAPLVLLAWTRLRRLSARFASLAAAGRVGRLAPASVAPRRADPAALFPLPDLPQPYRLPRGFGWLLRLAPETAAYGGQVEHWLADPELAAVLAKAPQAGRILRPLCRMLGVRPGPALCKPRLEAKASSVAPAVSGRRPAVPGGPDAVWSAEPPRPAGARSILAGADPPLGRPAPA
jgi:hypothetical protein